MHFQTVAPDAQSLTSVDKRPPVLVVEDNELVMNVLCDILGEDYDVFCAATAEAALSVLTGERIDVVLLDYHLCGGGSQVIVERAEREHLPVVWMTGDARVVEALGATDAHILLLKPFSIQQVLEALANALR